MSESGVSAPRIDVKNPTTSTLRCQSACIDATLPHSYKQQRSVHTEFQYNLLAHYTNHTPPDVLNERIVLVCRIAPKILNIIIGCGGANPTISFPLQVDDILIPGVLRDTLHLPTTAQEGRRSHPRSINLGLPPEREVHFMLFIIPII